MFLTPSPCQPSQLDVISVVSERFTNTHSHLFLHSVGCHGDYVFFRGLLVREQEDKSDSDKQREEREPV